MPVPFRYIPDAATAEIVSPSVLDRIDTVRVAFADGGVMSTSVTVPLGVVVLAPRTVNTLTRTGS